MKKLRKIWVVLLSGVAAILPSCDYFGPQPCYYGPPEWYEDEADSTRSNGAPDTLGIDEASDNDIKP